MKKGIKIILLLSLIILSGCTSFIDITGEAKRGKKVLIEDGKREINPQCDDKIDNDADGFCDYLTNKTRCNDGSIPGDPDCASRDDNNEASDCVPVPERCDGFDNNCNGQIDEDAVCTTDYYCDSDNDGYIGQDVDGICYEFQCTPIGCSPSIGNDCNDNNSDINPGVVENCDFDKVDNDCDGIIDECNDPCFNGKKDGSETDVDCGGSCKRCEVGQTCNSGSNCITKLCLSGKCSEQPSNLDPLCKPLKYDNNIVDGHVNLVFVPSAFNGDMELFRQKAEWVYSIFNNYVPFNNTISKLNSLYVTKEDNNINCYYGCNGIDRLLCCNIYVAKQLSSICTSGPRQTIVIHNNEKYGGAGYITEDVATTSVHLSGPKVAVHELGHSLFNLGDEYTPQDFSNPLNSPNCDYSPCNKWVDMMGYGGVACISNRCSNGAYYSSETSIMYSLSYKFEEVNQRLSCCSYYLETGTFPLYCNKFLQFTLSKQDLNEFCQISNPYSPSPAPPLGEILQIPYEYSFLKDEAGNWFLESITPRRQGKYPINKVNGQGKGNIRIKVTRENGVIKNFKFEEDGDVEYLKSIDRLGGYTKIPRRSLSIIVDHKPGKVKTIEIIEIIKGK